MNFPSFLDVSNLPDLRAPTLIAAFAGWNDAAQVATSAVDHLRREWDTPIFASIDPEDFFDFTETRPMISLGASGQRSLTWPSNSFFARRDPDGEHDFVLLVGTEPQLKWRTFCDAIVQCCQATGAQRLVTLGGLLADVPHTLDPPRLTGFASDKTSVPQLRRAHVGLSAYQGPTGVVGALHDAWHRAGMSAFSLWGNVPHYVSASPNPQITLALLQAAAGLLGMDLPLTSLTADAERFRRQIDEAVAQNPEAEEYVRQLEEQFSTDIAPADTPDLLAELESFLRSRRPEDDQQGG